MKYLFLTLFLLFAIPKIQAQYTPFYNFALGLRAGSSGNTCGLTAKGFVSNNGAIEGILGYYRSGVSGTILFEQHVTLFRKKEMQFYFGGGAHYTNSTDYQNWIIFQGKGRTYEQVKNSYGFDAIFGFEYKLISIPLAFSVDLKPAIELNNLRSFSLGLDQGLGLKYTF